MRTHWENLLELTLSRDTGWNTYIPPCDDRIFTRSLPDCIRISSLRDLRVIGRYLNGKICSSRTTQNESAPRRVSCNFVEANHAISRHSFESSACHGDKDLSSLCTRPHVHAAFISTGWSGRYFYQNLRMLSLIPYFLLRRQFVHFLLPYNS